MLARTVLPTVVTCALLGFLPGAASAATVKVKTPEPDPGKVGVLGFTVKAKGGKKLPDIKLGVQVAKAARDDVGVVVETVRGEKSMDVTVILLNRGSGSGRTASNHRDVVMTLKTRKGDRQVLTGDVDRIIDVLSTLTEAERKFVCKKKKVKGKNKRIRALLGNFIDGKSAPGQIVAAIRRLLCGKLTAADIALFKELGTPLTTDDGGGGDDGGGDDGGGDDGGDGGDEMPDECTADPTAPGCTDGGGPDPCTADPFASGCYTPDGTFGCTEFAGNPNEGTCGFNGSSFNRLKVEATGNLTFIQCYIDPPASCELGNPGTPNNFILYTFPGPQTNSGDLFLRGDGPYSMWTDLHLYGSNDGGNTFAPRNVFDPP